MAEPKISVIIPIYNVEHYIRRCLKSVLAQTYHNLEIILVDDGSTDSSGSICDAYERRYRNIRVIHQSNGGLSNARNTGIEAVSGKYIIFIDSDDFVDPDYAEYLYHLVRKYHTRMGICQHRVLLPNSKIREKGTDRPEEKISAGKCIERMLYHDVIDTSAWAKIYDRELFRDISFPEGKLFEDIATTYKLMHESRLLAVGYRSKYVYVVRKSSIVNANFNIKKLDLIEMTDKMADEVVRWYPDLDRAAKRRQAYARFSTLNQMIGADGVDRERSQIISELKLLEKDVVNNKKTPVRDKAAFALLNVGYPVYAFAWKLYLRNEGK